MVPGLLDHLQILRQPDKIDRAFISKALGWIWHAYLLHKLKPSGVSGQVFGLIFSSFSNSQLWVILDGKSLQEYPVNGDVCQGSILDPTLFILYTLMTFLTSDLWQELELASKIASDQ